MGDGADQWAQVLSVNLTGVFNGCRSALRHMISRRGGAIVSTALLFD